MLLQQTQDLQGRKRSVVFDAKFFISRELGLRDIETLGIKVHFDLTLSWLSI